MTSPTRTTSIDLPELWCRRLTDELRAAEEQVVVCVHEAGDGLERLIGLWGEQGRMVTLRSAELASAETLSRAIVDRGDRPRRTSPRWFAGIASASVGASPSAEPSELRSALRPGERLLLLVPKTGEDRGSEDSAKGLDPGLRTPEIVDWAGQRWGLRLEAARAEELRSTRGGVLRPVETGLSELAAQMGPRPTRSAGAKDGRVPRIQLELLGVPRIRWVQPDLGQSEELRWGYRGVLEVVSALAVAPDMRLPGSEMLERLWPNLDSEEARKRLYPAVSHARRLFAKRDAPKSSSAIVASGGVYGLNPDWRWDCDVVRLRDVVRRSMHVSDDLMQSRGVETDQLETEPQLLGDLEAAWAGYRGDFLETSRSAWVRAEREEQRRQYLVVLRRLAALRHAEPEAVGLEDVLRTILVADPIAEDAHVALMRLYSRRGRADLVRRQYDRMCRVLMDDLGLQPMDRTVREVERLMAS